MKKTKLILRKFFVGLCVFALLITQTIGLGGAVGLSAFAAGFEKADVADGPNDIETIYDLVAVVVDKDLDNDLSFYVDDYLQGKYGGDLKAETIGERVVRYAQDVRGSRPLTDVRILIFDKEKESVADLSNALENLYWNGDDTHNNRLAGVVLVGDVPLPVVNKNGNRFISMFPYTDFENKAYLYDEGTKSFEKNNKAEFVKSEIWHGIIRAPEGGSNKRLATFFDKNHLYYEGVAEFAQFDQKMFYADLINEEKNMNEDTYQFYLNYLDEWENLAYNRYNKFWAQDLTSGVLGSLPVDPNYEPAKPILDGLQSGNPLAMVPDIYTKQIIDQYLTPYYKIFSKHIADVNDFAENTGRYAKRPGDAAPVDNMPVLISVKDEYTKRYFRDVNTAIEKKINEVVEKIEEPLPVLKSVNLSGSFIDANDNEKEFSYAVSGGSVPAQYVGQGAKSVDLRYNFWNEVTGKLYVNGVNADVLSSPKQCSVYLGSVDDEDFQNGDYLPKDGYSILTRSTRVDDARTAFPVHTAGVHTRLLNAEELAPLTAGKASSGAVVEDNPDYGISAFIDNPLRPQYKNVLEEPADKPNEKGLRKGDVITKVNGKSLDYQYSFDQAVEEAYSNVKSVINAVRNKNLSALNGLPYEILVKEGENLQQANPTQVLGNLGIEFYRGGILYKEGYTFTVDLDGHTTISEGAGDPELFIKLSSIDLPVNLFDAPSDGVIFTLYDTADQGFANEGYDNSAGCNVNSSAKNSDRCFGRLATLPVLDAAGSVSLVKIEVPGEGFRLMFPENVKKDYANNPQYTGFNSTQAADYADHMPLYQYPQGYALSELDEVYMNSCYSGLPSLGGLEGDSNPYKMPLDPSSFAGNDFDINQDFYGRFEQKVAEFVNGSNKNNSDKGGNPDHSPSKVNDWLNIDNLTAGNIVLNNIDGGEVTLRHFSDRYGLFDGIDNDGDGIRDFKWQDNFNLAGEPKPDGIFETRFYDYDEIFDAGGNLINGIPSENLDEIARKMLSHNSIYRIPASATDFGEDIVLKVNVDTYGGKKISSMIHHNEPTDHTISEQVSSGAAFSMPIDNPRYVAFLSTPAKLPEYPEPQPIGVPDEKVQEFLDKLDTTPHYFTGKVEKILYPNVFEVTNYDQLVVDLDLKAWEIAQLPGSYKLTGGAYLDCSGVISQENFDGCKSIHDVIYKDYLLAAVANDTDLPQDGFDLEKASAEKITDAFAWRDMNIDEKHEYVLRAYLNPAVNGFVNDATLFPAQPGYETESGYEAAYLVLDGEKDYFNMGFNKDLKEEKDPHFNQLELALGSGGFAGDGGPDGAGGGAGAGGGEVVGGGDDGIDEGFVFVDLSQFLKETREFLEYFTEVPGFKDACNYAEEVQEQLEAAKEGYDVPEDEQLEAASLELSADVDLVKSGGVEQVFLSVKGRDVNGKLVGKAGNDELISITIDQNESAPVFELTDLDKKTLSYGMSQFVLKTTNNVGSASVVVTSDNGLVSNTVTLSSVGSSIQLSSFTVFSPEGVEDLLGNDGGESGDGGSGGGDGDGDGDGGSGSGIGDGGGDNGGGGATDNGGAVGNDNGGSDGNGSNGGGTNGGGGDENGVGVGGGGGAGNGNFGDGSDGAENGAESGNMIGSESELAGNLDDVLSDLEDAEKASDLVDGQEVDSNSGVGAGSGVAGDGSGETGSGDGSGGGGDGGDGDGGEKTILVSTPVEKIVLYSVLIEEEEQLVEKWEEYFVLDEYYKKFLEDDFEDGAGAYVISSRLVAEVFSDVNPFVDAYENENSPYMIQPGNSMVADGESLMMVEASIYDGAGNLVTQPHNVRFSIIEKEAQVYLWDGDSSAEVLDVRSENGVATIYLKAGTKAGTFKVKAEVLDGIFPVQKSPFVLVAGEPVVVELETESAVLVANGQSKARVQAILKDKFGNIANNTFASVAFFADGAAYLDEAADRNGQLLGVQVDTIEGVAGVDLMSSNKTGKANVIALLLDFDLEQKFLEASEATDIDFTGEIGNSLKQIGKEVEVVDGVNLKLDWSEAQVVANGKNIVKLRTEMQHNGKKVAYGGPVKFTLLTPNLAKVVSKLPSKFPKESAGVVNEENVKLQVGKTVGELSVLVEAPGFVLETAEISVVPGAPASISLSASKEYLNTGGKDEVILKASLLDANGNLVSSENSKIIDFAATAATQDLVNFSGAKSAVALNGVASTVVKAKDISGQANFIAGSSGVSEGAVSVKVTNHITSSDVDNNFSGFAPRALYTSLLGGTYGNILDNQNLAQTLLYSDQTVDGKIRTNQIEAVSAVSASPHDKKRLFGIDGYGAIDLLSESVKARVVAATDSFPYQKVVFSDALAGVELGTMFMIPNANSSTVLLEDGDAVDGNGVYVQRVTNSDEYIKFVEHEGSVDIEKFDDVLAKVDQYGRIFVNDESFVLRLVTDDDGLEAGELGFVIEDRGQVLAHIRFVQSFEDINEDQMDVKVLPFGTDFETFFPGIYFEPGNSSEKYDVVSSFTRSSSSEPKGVYVVDTENELDSSQEPGGSYTSLEDGGDTGGVGFSGDNKHMLLFAAGNSVGESHVPYGSEVGMIFGDPNVRLEVNDVAESELTHFSNDLGKQLLAGDGNITELIELDFNGDNKDDLLVLYENGLVRLLEREISNRKYRDKGYILDVYGGISSAVKIDVNNDGFDDLIVGTIESCRADEEVYTAVYLNTGGGFERSELDLDFVGKAYEMKSADLNTDGCEDLVVTDSSANVRLFYNKNEEGVCKGLSKNHDKDASWNFGYALDPKVNMSENLFVNYGGMPGVAADNYDKFITFVFESTNLPTDNEAVADATDLQNYLVSDKNPGADKIPPQTYPRDYNFVHLPYDNKLLSSQKFAIDQNGGSVGMGDRISYQITLKNSGASEISNLALSDLTPATMTLDLESLKCLDGDCSIGWLETGMSLRSHVVSGISVPAGGQRILQYEMVVNEVPEIHVDLGKSFKAEDGSNLYPPDDYVDILVRPSVNPDGILTYLYSTGTNSQNNYVKYDTKKVSPSGKDYGELYSEVGGFDPGILPGPEGYAVDGNGMPILPPKLKDAASKILSGSQSKLSEDKDYNGCTDNWSGGPVSDYEDVAEGIAQEIEALSAASRCGGGGCLPIPYNYALFAPSDLVPGLPVFSGGTPNFPFFAPFPYPNTAPSWVRLYVSPTLTMGLGTAVCVNQYPGGFCYAFAIPVSSLGVCPDILGPINDAITTAKNAVVNPDIGMTSVVSDGTESNGVDAINTGGSYSGTKSPVSASAKVNIRVPGFPSVFVDWIDNQTDEIFTKLLDLPDFYFIYPDGKTLISQYASAGRNTANAFDFENGIQGLHDILNALNSMPLLQIEGKEVMIRMPTLSQAEWEKWKRQAVNWVEYEKQQVEKVKKYWKCDENEYRSTLCDIVTVKMTDLITKVTQIMEKLDKIANLPQEVLQWRHAEQQYATQIICYLDAMMQFTGGYINKQQKTIESWSKAIQDTIRTFTDWKIILDLMVEYQESCDSCKNDRFSKLGILLQLFAAIPEPPVIPFPKWPDIVFDISQIKAGIKITWPDLVFKPEKITLPNIPLIDIPDVLPEDLNITIDLDKLTKDFEIPDWLNDFPDFVVPNLPPLPPLPIPDLPDLPRPPKIPKLPPVIAQIAINLKPILKILCLIKLGFVPVAESSLGTEIETLTQPSVQAVLPIISNFGVQMPAVKYDSWKQIRINAKLNMGIDTSAIYEVVKLAAEESNEKVKEIIEKINSYTTLPWEDVINNFIDKLKQDLNKEILEGVDAVKEGADAVEEGVSYNYEDVFATPGWQEVEANFAEINDTLEEYVANLEVEDYPDTYYLTATLDYMDASHPLLNRSLAEVEADILKQDLPNTPAISHMAELRDSLIAYTKNLEQTNDLVEEMDDFNSMGRVLAENDQSLNRIAALTLPVDSGFEESKGYSVFGEGLEEAVKEQALSIKGVDGALLAGVFDGNFQLNPKDIASSSAPLSAAKGVYVVVGSKSENVLNYREELGGSVFTLFTDADDDKDFDMIIALGGDIYLKENYEFMPKLSEGDVVVSFNSAVSDFVNEGGDSVAGVTVPFESHETVDIEWLPKDKTKEYEVVVKNSLLDDFVVYSLTTTETRATLEIENGNYFVQVYAIDEDENKSLASEVKVISPLICRDDDVPLPAVSSETLEVPIFGTAKIDASNSFDPTGEIASYWIESLPYNAGAAEATSMSNEIWSDVDVSVDSDGNGVKSDDRDNPKFNLGPFNKQGDVGLHHFILHVVDQAGNSSSQSIEVDVFVPSISLDKVLGSKSIASGEVSPAAVAMPFSLIRSRAVVRVVDGVLSIVPDALQDQIITPSANGDGQYLTDANGKYEISDFDLEDMILVQNAAKEIVAEINPKTGNVKILVDGYETVVNEAKPPKSPTSVSIVGDNGNVMADIFLVANPNVDVEVFKGVNFDADSIVAGVGVSDLSEEIEFKQLGADDPAYPGGVVMVSGDKNLMIVDSAGNVFVLDKEVSLVQKANDHVKDPLIIDVIYKGSIVAEIYVSTIGEAQIVGPNDVPYLTPNAPSVSALYKKSISGAFGAKVPFDDFDQLDEEMKNSVIDLYEKGILEGSSGEDGTELNVKISQKINRAEFVKMVLKMLCMIPRKEDYQAYAPGDGFNDIPFNADDLVWFYPFVKEAYSLGLVDGYEGEVDEDGLVPFKPNNTINRAEAVKIILEALEMRGVIDLSEVPIASADEPWYVPYMNVAKNLTPYMTEGSFVANNYLVTKEEAADPAKDMTRGDLIEMAVRVLEINNCFESDEDGDGMSDYCEEKYGISDPSADEDNDGLKNVSECYYGFDPLNADSDGGGANDGDELNWGTDPLNGSDDPADSDGDGLTDLAEILIYGTDANDFDTDNGGVGDGDEVKAFTDPLNGDDDGTGGGDGGGGGNGGDGGYQGGEPGLYIVPPECNTCPCQSTFLHKADLIPGDRVFSAIIVQDEEDDEKHVLSKSLEVIIKSLSK